MKPFVDSFLFLPSLHLQHVHWPICQRWCGCASIPYRTLPWDNHPDHQLDWQHWQGFLQETEVCASLWCSSIQAEGQAVEGMLLARPLCLMHVEVISYHEHHLLLKTHTHTHTHINTHTHTHTYTYTHIHTHTHTHKHSCWSQKRHHWPLMWTLRSWLTLRWVVAT